MMARGQGGVTCLLVLAALAVHQVLAFSFFPPSSPSTTSKSFYRGVDQPSSRRGGPLAAVQGDDLLFSAASGNDDFTNEQELDYLEWLAGKYRRKGKGRQATSIEWDIRKRQMFDTRAVLRVNEAFYYAFTKQDFRLMAKLWSNSPDTTCIHPGMAEVVVGYDKVLRLWKEILAPTRTWVRVIPENVTVVVRGNTAFAYCYERVVQDSVVANKEEQKMFATNVFYRNNSIWSIVHHHATLVKPPAPDKSQQQQQQQQNAMLGQQLGGLSPQILQQLQGLQGLNGARIISLGGLKAGGGSLDDLASQLEAMERQVGDKGNQQPRIKRLKDGRLQILSGEDDDDDDDDDDDEVGGVQRDKALTQKTVRAIQQLANDGRITAEQKTRLLHMIIQHANDDVPSMVEIAYELLLRNDDTEADSSKGGKTAVLASDATSTSTSSSSKEDDVLDEFADQCRIIADDMLPNL